MATNNLDADTMGPEETQSPCHFMKLFDGYDPHGTLWKVRNKIYSYVWSRNRRDKAKFDWVLSQYGVNRNVPERFVPDSPYSTPAFRSIDKLRCWLMLANKTISAEFTAYIYSLNFLEIDVDLKAMHTTDNEANLRRMTTMLQNQNFVRYTQSVRVRIHFPDKYPFQDLPTFNQRALEDIAATLDTFKNMEYMDVRIVSMQDPRDYELRFAAFPFYQMGFTDWSIHVLNDTITKWDVVDGLKVHHLNKAWSLYQSRGSLTEPVDLGVVEDKSIDEAQMPDKGVASHTENHTSAHRKNGSQKRRGRKMRATVSATTDTGSAPASSSVAASSRPGTPVSVSKTEIPVVTTSSQPTATNLEQSEKPLGESAASEPLIASAGGRPQTPSPSPLPSNRPGTDSSADTSVFNTSGEIVLTPDESSVASPGSGIIPMVQLATEAEDTAEPNESMDAQASQMPCPFSPTLSSATLGRSENEDGTLSATGKVLGEASSSANKRDCENTPQKKKRRNRKKTKKPKKPKAVNTTTHLAEAVEEQPVSTRVLVDEDEVDINQDQEVSYNENTTLIDGQLAVFTLSKPNIPLSEFIALQPCGENLCVGTKADGCKVIMSRTKYTERHFRQQERAAVSQLEKEAEKTRAKSKRQSKKAKEALLRRRQPSHNLRCQAENAMQPNVGNRSSGLRDQLDISDTSDDGLQAYDDNSDVSSELSGLNLDKQSCVGNDGGSDSHDDGGDGDDDEDRRQFGTPTSHERFQTPDLDYADMTLQSHGSFMSTSANGQDQHVPDEEVGPEGGT